MAKGSRVSGERSGREGKKTIERDRVAMTIEASEFEAVRGGVVRGDCEWRQVTAR